MGRGYRNGTRLLPERMRNAPRQKQRRKLASLGTPAERYSTATGTSHARALFFKKRRDQIRHRRNHMPNPLTGQTLADALTALDTLTQIAKSLPPPTRIPLMLTLNRIRELLGLP